MRKIIFKPPAGTKITKVIKQGVKISTNFPTTKVRTIKPHSRLRVKK